jgi:hypothetical protein
VPVPHEVAIQAHVGHQPVEAVAIDHGRGPNSCDQAENATSSGWRRQLMSLALGNISKIRPTWRYESSDLSITRRLSRTWQDSSKHRPRSPACSLSGVEGLQIAFDPCHHVVLPQPGHVGVTGQHLFEQLVPERGNPNTKTGCSLVGAPVLRSPRGSQPYSAPWQLACLGGRRLSSSIWRSANRALPDSRWR